MNKFYNKRNETSFSKEYRDKLLAERAKNNEKLYLGEIIDIEKPEFSSNNLIIAPVGSGKSYLIENKLIPENFSGKALYLTSNTALKDSIAPNNNKLRKENANSGKSRGFFTTDNKNRFGNVPYSVHVMTYHEFGLRIRAPFQSFTEKIELIFSDEIHSLPIYTNYGNNGELLLVLNWLFRKHEGIKKYYFTATNESIETLERNVSGYLNVTKIFNYLEYSNIVKYQARSTYYISNEQQLRMHLKAKFEYIDYNNKKGLAFTRRIKSQKKLESVARSEGYKPITLWSVNNEDYKLSKEQIRVRDEILKSGIIPDPYNLLIINGSMQEGWNLHDESVEFSILDTLNKTEQVQALGRIRKDIDFLLLKVSSNDSRLNNITITKEYLNAYLTTEEKELLSKELDLRNDRGELVKWTTVKRKIIDSGYEVNDLIRVVDDKRQRVSVITEINTF